jgi:hypothetical protein
VQNLRASRQCRGEKLTQSQWEVQGGDQEWHQTRIDETTDDD